MVSKDDNISCKANSTDITITGCTFINGLGIAIGSIGQYKDEFETIERVRAENIGYRNTLHAVRLATTQSKTVTDGAQVYFKTWTGEQVGYPPNGGGGGLGCT